MIDPWRMRPYGTLNEKTACADAKRRAESASEYSNSHYGLKGRGRQAKA